MKTSLSLLMVVGTALVSFTACGTETKGTCEETLSCGGTDGGGDVVIGADGGGDVVQPPAGCDQAAEPKDAPKCVVSEFGVFVDATNGADANAGTKASPVKSITAALGKLGSKARVYVCEGTYAEHVKVTSAVSLYGGFACSSWNYSGNKAKIAPPEVGYALEIAGAKGAVVIADLSMLVVDAVAKGESSIAGFVHGSSDVLVLRSELLAGNGKEGVDGIGGATGTPTTGDLDGNSPVGVAPGLQKTCACTSGGSSTGGGGGAPSAGGGPGTPNFAGAASAGSGGLGSTGCTAAEPNGSGKDGANALPAADAPMSTALGILSMTGWTSQPGADGVGGGPGQGGGGGGGLDGTKAGGSGGCGGCGGTNGKGGTGGGASVALLSLDSTVVLRGATVTSKAAGAGGKGGAKGTGANGGAGGPANCSGGAGGRGGDGGSGGGGVGGVSAAILHKGPAPTNDGSTLTPGTKGAKGLGGTPGSNDGVEGQSAAMLAVQ
jgi:hypothetical protein